MRRSPTTNRLVLCRMYGSNRGLRIGCNGLRSGLRSRPLIFAKRGEGEEKPLYIGPVHS
jgi:hypothetical protein